MFLYGGVKYVISADDPGGRKQGKMICIHAMVGGLLFMLWTAINTLFANQLGVLWGSCT